MNMVKQFFGQRTGKIKYEEKDYNNNLFNIVSVHADFL